MRPIAIVLAAAIATSALPQATPPESANTITLRHLNIESTTLPDQDRLRLLRIFENKSYYKDELQPRLHQATRDLGYFYAVVDITNLSDGAGGSTAAVKITAGPRYRFGEIRFQGGTVFSNARLRQIFAVQSGSLFSPTQAGRGIEALREAYSTEGYINCVFIPELLIYETDHIIALNISIDEGAVFHFGRLLMDGVERHPGDAAALTQSWNSLSGARFDSRLIDRWLSENQFACPDCTRSRNIDIETNGREQGLAEVHLSLPPAP